MTPLALSQDGQQPHGHKMAADTSLSYILLGLNQIEVNKSLCLSISTKVLRFTLSEHLHESSEIHSGQTGLDHTLTLEPVVVLTDLDLTRELSWNHVDHRD